MTRMCIVWLLLWAASVSAAPWNNPHASTQVTSVRYQSFSGAPKTLDPARAYSSNELQFIAQIYEPPLQYHLLKRPYHLVPLTTTAMPVVNVVQHNGQTETDYDISIRPGIYYQPHPAFAKNQKGAFLYHHLTARQAKKMHSLADFAQMGTRELTADDYIYEIKRLASPTVSSPILGMMQKHIIGLKAFSATLRRAYQMHKGQSHHFFDLRQFNLSGVERLGQYRYRIRIQGRYPQFKYWLAMPFFAPIPWEADAFYSQGVLQDNGHINFNWYPVGTGPYYLSENNPNRQMVLTRNPNFHGEQYPSTGMPGDREKGYLAAAGQSLPMVDQFVFSLEKESIPRWNKFLQGYYDHSGISADSFDQAIQLDDSGDAVLTPALKKKQLRLETTVAPAIFYLGFNMLDPVVGGHSQRARDLRQAISIAVNYEEYISIFMNGRGIAAQGPIPPGIFGYEAGQRSFNPVVYHWDDVRHKAVRWPISHAKVLLDKAGYPNGIDPATGRSLILNYDVTSSGSPDDQARFQWMRKQFAKLGITLNIRSTQYNRFQDKVRRGNAQIFSWGWMADYPDPENFLFLLYGPNGKAKHGGENAANYNNAKTNALFEQMKAMQNGPARQRVIDEMVAQLRQDSPWLWGVHPIDFSLSHQWNQPLKPNAMANNLLKYQQLDSQLRARKQQAWNRPVLWPIALFGVVVLLVFLPLIISYWRRQRQPTVKRYDDGKK